MLRSHKDDIAAMDLFTVSTASLRLLYGFFVIEHGRRHIVHFNATFHPTAAWVIQQLRDAFSYDPAPRYIIFDRDSIFSAAVVRFIKTMGTKPVRTSFRSPWQIGTAERWIGNWPSTIVANWDSKKTRRTRDRSRRDRHPRPRSWR